MLVTPVEVKKAYKSGVHRKNYRFVVLKDDGTEDFTIDNNTLVAESVHIDERMASGSELKFGLCEGSSLEFQYFNHDNINGKQIKSFIDIEYEATSVELTATDDTFTVPEAGSYQILVPAGSTSFEIKKVVDDVPGPAIEVSTMNVNQTFSFNNLAVGTELVIDSSNAVSVTVSRTDEPTFTMWHSTPMGYFTVKECPRQFSTGIYKATAYNKLQSDYLDADIIQSATPTPEDYVDGKIATYALRCRLLSDYSISYYEENETRYIPGYPTQAKYTAGFPSITFKLSGSSATWYPQFASRQDTWARTDTLSNVYMKLGDMSLYADLLDSMVAHIYQAITLSVVSPATLWDQLKGVIYQAASIEVTFLVGQTYNYRYYTSDDIYDWAIAAGATDVRKLSDIGYLYNVKQIFFYTPSVFMAESGSTVQTIIEPSMVYSLSDVLDGKLSQIAYSNMDEEDLIRVPITNVENATLRQIMTATYELTCQFGKLDRETDYFSGVELNGGGLYPAETLYPANSLYPNDGTGGLGIHPYPSEYSQLWTDTMGEQSFRYLIITYKTLDDNNNEVDATFQKTINSGGTTDYNMSDNWLLRNQIWTEQQISDFAGEMKSKMQYLRWFPFEMWAAGLPYVETGDAIEITDRDGETHISYILQRQLQGIQNLQDTYINGELDIF